jgi:hypothetical protein
MEKPGTSIRRTGMNTKICGRPNELSDGTQCSAKEKCGNDGNTKYPDALLRFIAKLLVYFII